MLHKDEKTLHNFEAAIQNEWLETNGLGGWSSSSIICCHTRRYHGLLVAATHPPTDRMALVSKLDETIVSGGQRFELGTNNYGNTIHPTGHLYQTGFTKKIFPEFFYAAGNIQLKKTIGMVHGENTVTIIYSVTKAADPFILELLPLLSVRGYHNLMHANDAINPNASFDNHIFITRAYNETPEIFIKIPGAAWHADPKWFYNFNYNVEKYRGLEFREDLFTHGVFSVELKEGDELGIVISTEYPGSKDAFELLSREKLRREFLVSEQPADETLQQLVLASDQFIVRRDYTAADGKLQAGATVIAGYHWFTDWSRDTMISLPGLTLSTGRHEDAKKILAAFAKSVSMGMLPNRFQDNGQAPEYNTVDGTLWYFVAAYKYVDLTDDRDFILREILPVLKEIIDWHFKGTRYNIHVDQDGLLHAGETGMQLTWMDAKVGNWVVTPRMGKPVEIQALWYNALKIFSELLQLNNQNDDAAMVEISAEKAKQSFLKKFWYAEGNYLYDSLDENNQPVAELRPNQLFAISLPFALIEGEQASAVIKIIEEQLYTPVGLRTLPQADPHYIPVYGGDQYHRDAAYHQGTVWSWLLGPYVDALIKVEDEAGRIKAMQVIEDFKYHLNEACTGSVSEIFDGDAPHHPRGCIAQAWGVAEILRVIKDYELYGNTQTSPDREE